MNACTDSVGRESCAHKGTTLCHVASTSEAVSSAMSRALTAARVREAAAAKALDERDGDDAALYEAWVVARKHLKATEEASLTCPF